MAKLDIVCPFTHRPCKECAIYRGRHYYLGFYEQHQGGAGQSKGNTESGIRHQSVDSQTLRKLAEPWAGARSQRETELEIRLKVIDMESGATRVCELDEAETWDWSSPDVVRMVSGIQITSWEKLVEIVRFKSERGYQEVEVHEAPHFMLLAGG